MSSDSETGRLQFEVGIDTSRLRQETAKAGNEFQKLANTTKKSSVTMEGALAGIGKAAASLGLAVSMQQFAQKVIQVRGEFQKLSVAMETMLQSKTKADALMAQMVRTAATTPFGLTEVANGAKQLLAYGLEAEKVNETLIRLGDIAAGLSIPLGDLVYLYGTTMAQGRLYTQDFNQFTGRGIPMIRELAKQFGVAEGQVKELVEAGKVGFPEVQKVIESLTDAGGTFGGLMEKQSATITGQIANIEDAFDMMFNEIGQGNEGVINTALSGVSYLVENYEQVGRVLASVIATYGAYRAALMAITAASGWASAAEALRYNWLLLVEKAQKLLNATMLANPYVAAAAAVTALVGVLVSMRSETERMRDAQNRYNEEQQKAADAYDERIQREEKLISMAEDETLSTDARRAALVQLIQQYPEVFSKYQTEYDMLTNIRDIKREIAAIEAGKDPSATTNELSTVNAKIAALENKKSRYVDTGAYTEGAYAANSGLTKDEEAELKMLRNRRNALTNQMTKDKVNDYMKNLTGVSNAELQNLINGRRNLLAKMESDGKRYGTLAGNSRANGTFSKDELQGQLQLLQAEQTRRSAAKKTSGEWEQGYKKQYNEAVKKLNDFRNGSEKMDEGTRSSRLKELEEAVETAKKRLSQSTAKSGKSGSGDTAAERKAEIEKTAKEVSDAEAEAAKERIELQRELAYEIEQSEIDLLEEGWEKTSRQLALDHRKEQSQLEKQKEDAVSQEITRQKAVFDAKENEKKAKDSGYVKRTFTDDDIDSEPVKSIEKQYESLSARLAQNQAKATAKAQTDALNAQTTALSEYLRQYGDYEQKRLAIAQEYAEKIAKAQTVGERLTLESERDKQLSDLAVEQFKGKIDWEGVFNDLDSYSLEYLKKLKAQLQEELGNADILPEDAKTLAGQIDKINDAIVSKSNEWRSAFGLVIPELEKIKRLKEESLAAQEALNKAEEAHANAAANLSGTRSAIADYLGGEGISVSTDEVNTGNAASLISRMKALGIDTEELEALLSELGKAECNAAKSTEDLQNATTDAAKASDKAKGSLSSTVRAISESMDLVVSNVQSAKDLVEQLGLEGTGLGKGISSFSDSVGSASKAFTSFTTGDYIGAIANAHSALTSLGDALGSWGIGGFGSSDRTLEDDIERLTASNEALQFAIEELTDEMSEATATEAVDIYRQQKENLSESESNIQELMRRSAAAYSNGFLGIGGKSSSNVSIDRNMTLSEWERISGLLNKNVRNAAQFWDLSSEEMRKIATDAPDIYAHIKELADDGYKDAAQYMDSYIDFAKQREELENAYMEKQTSFSFDDLRSEFKNCLTDMTSDWSDFTENFNDMLVESMAEALMTEKYDDKIKALYKKWAEDMEDGELTDDEIAEWQRDRDAILSEMRADRENLQKVASGGTSQSGTSGGLATASQDSVDELNGRFTAIQMDASSIRETLSGVALQITAMAATSSAVRQNTDEIRNLSLTAVDYLQSIQKSNSQLYEINERLGKIEKYTSRI